MDTTNRQKQVLQAIKDHCSAHFRPPTMRYLASLFKINVSAMHNHVHHLKDQGLINIQKGEIRLLGGGVCPCCGRAAGGVGTNEEDKG